MTPDKFVERHIGTIEHSSKIMLESIGINSVDELIKQTIPQQIQLKADLSIGEPMTEFEFSNHVQSVAEKNNITKSYIGMGYYPTVTPAVIRRNVFENPGWYTQYTPYQAEISQGRLEALINYQTMIIDLTGLPIANASLLDEGTSAAEAMLMFYAAQNEKRKKFFIDSDSFPQTVEVLRTRALPKGIDIVIGNIDEFNFTEDFFALFIQYPAASGKIRNHHEHVMKAREKNIKTIFASDILSLTIIVPPGEFGADAVVGSTQRFGVPMGFGGPHAGYFATTEEFKRLLPGRIIGASIDSEGKSAFRMALQTREQHIRREKATSNICTAQVLLAVMAGMYAVYHGPKRLKQIAIKIHTLSKKLAHGLEAIGFNQTNETYFDTLKIEFSNSDKLNKLNELSGKANVEFFKSGDQSLQISLNETTNENDVDEIISLFSQLGKSKGAVKSIGIAETFERKTPFLQHPIFNSLHSETEMLRYIKRLENKDLSLTASMIPLGSCTMKLNAAAEMFPVSLPQIANIHPFTSEENTAGYKTIIHELENLLGTITGLPAVSLQPNSGAQGEYAGLMVIRKYLHHKGEIERNIVLIPSSAHGTNPASAVMAGMSVIVVKCDEKGNIDVTDLKEKISQHKNKIAALMVTYPSTHGVFEELIVEICELVHQAGGQVYMDGANMNAQVGLTNPKMIGADVCHLNLHKTFAIPHGGGGPGVGPICVAEHLRNFLPGHPVINVGGKNDLGTISAAPYGSASILLISYAYIKMLGGDGLKKATEYAILNANYLKSKLEKDYKVLYQGTNGRIAHELIFDMREFKRTAGVEVEDIAKRLMDYGFHAPTVSFPVAGTLMVEPTESESLFELDRFVEAMILIRKEIAEIENGVHSQTDNLLKNAPHTMSVICSNDWSKSYSREEAAFPTEWTRKNKFWPSTSRINSAFGDRNLVCACLPIEEYEKETA